jgi:hypothetical protein
VHVLFVPSAQVTAPSGLTTQFKQGVVHGPGLQALEHPPLTQTLPAGHAPHQPPQPSEPQSAGQLGVQQLPALQTAPTSQQAPPQQVPSQPATPPHVGPLASGAQTWLWHVSQAEQT